MTEKIYVATSRAVINKPSFDDKVAKSKLGAGFENQALSVLELAEHINQGYPFSAQHSGARRKANFARSNFVAVDIDSGMKLDEALAHPYVRENALLIYTTASHTAENNRYRILFHTNRFIETPEEMEAAYTGSIRMFGGDKSCKDACRLWFGSKDCQPVLLGNSLPEHELNNIIALGREERTRSIYFAQDGTQKNGPVIANRASIFLAPNQLVRMASNSILVPLSSLTPKTVIYCPVHVDERPSAVVTRNQHGVRGVYCSSCALTFWPEGTQWKRKQTRFDFDVVRRAVQRLADQEYPNDDLTNLDEADNLVEPTIDEISAWRELMDARSYITAHNRFVPNLSLTDGTTFVSSVKGSGKTEWIKNIVQQSKEQGRSVLLIGHRQSLLKSMSARAGLTCYFYYDNGKIKNNPPSRYYAICLDSMVKLLDPTIDKYDVVIIDESEQVIAHTTQNTLADKRRPTIMMSAHYLRTAQSVIFCDADLGAVTVEVAHQTARGDKPVRFLLNEYKPEGKSIDLYGNESHLIAEMVQAVGASGTHYVATNSRKKAKELETILAQAHPGLKIRLVTSEQAGDADTQAFISDIKNAILGYDVVIASPSLGTGVDITFDHGAKMVETVFGFFVPNVNTHFDIDQQLCRVRSPKAIKVWISPQRFNFETDRESIAAELVASKSANDAIVGYTNDGKEILDEYFLTIVSQVSAIRRASMNDLRGNFIEYQMNLGCQINVVDSISAEAKMGRQMITDAKEAVKEDAYAAVILATQITRAGYNSLCEREKNHALNNEERYSMRRFEIESFYRQNISEELMTLDNGGKFRSVLRMAEIFFAKHEEVISGALRDSVSEEKSGLFAADARNTAIKRKVLCDLLKAAGLADSWRLVNLDAVITQENLKPFVIAMLENKMKLESLFNLSLPSDLEWKSVSGVRRILALIGIKLTDPMVKKVRDKKIRSYKICPDSLEKILELIELRNQQKHRAEA